MSGLQAAKLPLARHQLLHDVENGTPLMATHAILNCRALAHEVVDELDDAQHGANSTLLRARATALEVERLLALQHLPLQRCLIRPLRHCRYTN
jgi:hypothetical protein